MTSQEDTEKAKKLMEIKFNMYKATKVTMTNIELALERSNNTDSENQKLNEQLQSCRSKMNYFTPEEIASFEERLKK
ncbi:hypothetical protein M9Y10_027177 [Tritrichomonas musculus]|uniref:Uncharacterized protein n=1 Tax=Tritrichomonas musculus TaxID=1915356 RepID=A0ABR2H5S1_9EUKA